MKEAGAVIVDPVSTGIDLFPLLEDTRTNYYEAQFSYDLYFRRLGPDAVIHNMDELVAKGGELVKPSIVKAYREFNSLMHHPDFLARRDTQETLQGRRHRAHGQVPARRARASVQVAAARTASRRERRGEGQSAELGHGLAGGARARRLHARTRTGRSRIEFLGRPFSEPTLFKLAYAYEQVSKNRKTPPTTPPLPGERFEY